LFLQKCAFTLERCLHPFGVFGPLLSENLRFIVDLTVEVRAKVKQFLLELVLKSVKLESQLCHLVRGVLSVLLDLTV